MIIRFSLCVLRTFSNFNHLYGSERMATACGRNNHILYKKPGQNHQHKCLSTSTRHSKGEGKEGGSYTWREALEYGLKGIAVVLLSYAICDEIVFPWYRAYQRGKQPGSLPEAMAVSRDEPTLREKDKTPFSSAKCTTHKDGGPPRSQRYNFLAEAVARAAPSVVFIEKAQQVDTIFGRQTSVSTGSGFIVSEDGYVLTNAHVVGNARSVKVKLASGKVVMGEVTDLDQVADLALLKLKVNQKLPALEFGSSSSLRPGEWVVALGSPLSLSNTIMAGIVSSCHRPSKELGLHHGGPDMQYVQTDAPITVGNSGGPLVNLDGEVIGVNTLTAGPGISFAIPSDFARDFVARANKTSRRVGKFTIGISMLTISPDMCHVLQKRGVMPSEIEKGVLVAQVWPLSVAAQAGLKKGDLIVRINGKEVTSTRQVYDMVYLGKRLVMEIIRNSNRKIIGLVPEKM